jgi:acetylglutamate kinase
MTELNIIKIGGNIIDDSAALQQFVQDFAAISGPKILVHGGGKLATQLAEQLQIPQTMIDGRRVTDAESLKIVTMVYAGYINKSIVAQLQAVGCNAVGLSGVDGNLIQAHKRVHPTIDYGFVGDIDSVNTKLLQQLINTEQVIVVAPITHNKTGQLLNTNADTLAQAIAVSLANLYKVNLVFCFEKPGVLTNAEDDSSVVPILAPGLYANLKATGKVYAGMLPKLDNAFAALQSNVHKVIIGDAKELQQLIKGTAGTTIIHE